MKNDFKDKIQGLINLETSTGGGVKNNPVINFSYNKTAYEKDEAAGTDSYNVSQNNNIPNASPVATNTNKTVLDRGYRSQGSSISRMIMNHFLGRTSYNLNKIHDWFTELLIILRDLLNATSIWNLKENNISAQKNFSLMLTPGTYKGTSFEDTSNYPDWFDQVGLSKFGYWDCIVEEGAGFLKQYLYYVKQDDGEAAGHYLAIRGALTNPEGKIRNGFTNWTSNAEEAVHAIQSDSSTKDGLGQNIVDTYAKKTELANEVQTINGKLANKADTSSIGNLSSTEIKRRFTLNPAGDELTVDLR